MNIANTKKAIIITRVSTAEQEDGKSLPGQLDNTQDYCQRNGLSVLKAFPLIESSTSGNRRQFKEAVDLALQHKECIAIVCDTVDRFQRSFRESVVFGDYIKDGKIELHFVRSGLKLDKNSTATELMMWDMNVLTARGANLQMRDATNRGLRQKFKDGELANKAPIGYRNVIVDNKKTVIVDETCSPFIKRAFEDYASGNYAMDEIARRLERQSVRTFKGTPIVRASIHRMLQCKFYYGIIEKYGEEREHIYPKLISKEIFDKCQEVRLGYKKQHINYGAEEHIFRNNLKCGYCGGFLSPYTKTKQIKSDGSKHEYIYLKCSKHRAKVEGLECENKNMRQEIALTQVKDAVLALHIDDIVLKEVLEDLRDNSEQNYQMTIQAEARRKKRLSEIETIRKQQFNMQAKGLLTEEELTSNLQELKKEEDELKALGIETPNKKQVIMNIERMARLLNKLPALFDSSKIEFKRLILRLIFSNLEMKGKKLDFTYTKPFGEFSKGSLCQVWGG